MKNSFECIKCGSADIIKIEGQRLNQNQIISLNKWGTANVILDRFLCASCGYTEEWIRPDDVKFQKWLKKNKDRGTLNNPFV